MAEPFPAEGLPLEEARRRVLEAITPIQASDRPPTRPQSVCPWWQALGRVSAEPIMASEAVPGFRASIMDGYAIADELPPQSDAHWHLVGRSAPGAPYDGVLAAGEAIRILTGAPLPEGARRVLPQELVTTFPEAAGDRLQLRQAAGPNAWIALPRRGSGPRAGTGGSWGPPGARRVGASGQLRCGNRDLAAPAPHRPADQRR